MVLGIALKDIIATILIPIVAVLTTLLVQQRQQRNERRMQVLRHLLATRHLPADPGYNAAINLIPIEFNKVKAIMTAWSEYISEVRFRAPQGQEEAHSQQVLKRQTKLITAIMKKMRLDYSEADIQADAYASIGFIDRDNLYIDSLKATRDNAEAMRLVATALAMQTQILQGVPPDALTPAAIPTDKPKRVRKTEA